MTGPAGICGAAGAGSATATGSGSGSGWVGNATGSLGASTGASATIWRDWGVFLAG